MITTTTASFSHLSTAAISFSSHARSSFTPASIRLPTLSARRSDLTLNFSGDGGGGGAGRAGSGGNSGGGGGGWEDDDDEDGERKKKETAAEAIFAMARLGRTMNTLPSDLAAAVKDGRIPGAIITRYIELDSHPIIRWLLQFGGFRERLLADDLFLTKVAIECGVGIFTKTAAELERRRDRFTKELDFVFADVVMALIADFMLVWLPAPTVSLRPPLAITAGPVAKFFHGCPDNAFQVAMTGISYSFLYCGESVLASDDEFINYPLMVVKKIGRLCRAPEFTGQLAKPQDLCPMFKSLVIQTATISHVFAQVIFKLNRVTTIQESFGFNFPTKPPNIIQTNKELGYDGFGFLLVSIEKGLYKKHFCPCA